MDTLEVVTLSNTLLEEEIEFLKFVLRNRDVRMISTQIALDGPNYLSLEDYRKIKRTGTANDCTLLLWNTGIPNPLCACLFLQHYDSKWSPIDPKYGEALPIPRSKEDFLALHNSFRKQPITAKLLRYAMYNRIISPVLELSISSEKTRLVSNDYFRITAEFCNWVNGGVWVIWNAFEQRWEHETRNLDRLFDDHFEQSSKFLKWQEILFDWIKENWSTKIVPSSTYRYD